MAQIIKNAYQPIELKNVGSKKLDELFIFYDGKYLNIDERFQIVTKRDEDRNILESRNVNSVLDLKKNISKLCVINSLDEFDDTVANSTIYFEGFSVPKSHKCTSDETSTYGLQRLIAIDLGEKLEGANKRPSDSAYLYVQIENEWTFLHPNQIFWYDGNSKKTYGDAISESKDLSTIKFFNEYNKEILSIFTEYEYKYGRVIEKEVVDLNKFTKSKVSVNAEDGTETVLESNVILNSYSDQNFIQTEVDDEKNPGKTKTSYQVKTTNYQTVKGFDLDDKNLFVWG